MKKTFTLAFCLSVVCSVVFSQGIIITPNDSARVTATATDEFEAVDVHIYVINNFGQNTSFMWRMIDYVAPQGWDLALCDNNNCYDLLLQNPWRESLEVPADDTMDFKFQYSPHCKNGAGSANVMIYVTGDSATTAVTLNYKADLTTACVTAVAQIGSNQLHFYPNPVKSTFTVSGLENAGDLSFEVFDMKGSTVKSEVKAATTSSIEISVESLPQGVYVLKAFDKNGHIAGTSRLSKVD